MIEGGVSGVPISGTSCPEMAKSTIHCRTVQGVMYGAIRTVPYRTYRLIKCMCTVRYGSKMYGIYQVKSCLKRYSRKIITLYATASHMLTR